MATTTTLAANAYLLHHNNHMPSLEQVVILDHAATLLQHLSHQESYADSKNASVDDIDDKDIIARVNGLLELLKCYGWYGE